MPRYFFHLRECGKVTADEEGIELADDVAARGRALTAAREVMCAEIAEGRLCLSCSIDIQSDVKDLVETILFNDAVEISGP